MSSSDSGQWITPTTSAITLETIEILTGRGFITGKSGSGKSNSASVIAEELLEHNYNLLIIDPEGEYYGLKEKYELLHVGNSEICDVEVGPQHADKIAEIALTKNLPVIVDVSDYLDGEEAKELISSVVEELYHLEKEVRKPFLLMIEEMQEYLPQSGGSDDLAVLLERVAKRGRKRGLGMLGMSQRPSSVDKDFITQCDWMVWHRLTWKNDLDVVKNVLGKERAEQVEEFDAGEGFLMTDWDDTVERVKFKKKRTHDAGATPGLESYERPDLKSVGDELLAEFSESVKGPSASAEPGAETEATSGVGAEGGPPGQSGVQQDLESAAKTVETSIDLDTHANQPNPQGADAPDTPPDLYDDEGLGRDPESMDEEELRELSRSLQRQNSVLKDEVTELRTILSEVETRERSQSTQSRAPETGEAQTTSTQQSQHSTESGVPTPPQPRPPNRPQDRSGLAGNLIEFTEFILYLVQMFIYKLRTLGRTAPEEKNKSQSS